MHPLILILVVVAIVLLTLILIGDIHTGVVTLNALKAKL